MIKVNKVYRHYKNDKRYIVDFIGFHTETDECMVIYHEIGTHMIWVRPSSMWFDNVGNGVTRFTLE